MAQPLPLDHGQPSFRGHVLEHPTNFRHVVTPTYISQYAGPEPSRVAGVPGRDLDLFLHSFQQLHLRSQVCGSL
ncbi:MAG: hypothetical protein ACK559_01940, partial [bacterium]